MDSSIATGIRRSLGGDGKGRGSAKRWGQIIRWGRASRSGRGTASRCTRPFAAMDAAGGDGFGDGDAQPARWRY
jgi:hypothetical protein